MHGKLHLGIVKAKSHVGHHCAGDQAESFPRNQPVLEHDLRHEVENYVVHMQGPRYPCAERETLQTYDWMPNEMLSPWQTVKT